MENDKYIIGKWYKTNAGSYVKYEETRKHDKIFIASESIMYGNREYSSIGGPYGSASNIFNFTEVDISEFKQYLPEDHPDRISKSVNDTSHIKPLLKLLNKINNV